MHSGREYELEIGDGILPHPGSNCPLAPIHGKRFLKKMFSHCALEELGRPAQSPHFNPIRHLWDELEL